MTCMPLIRRAYEANGGHIYHKPDAGGAGRRPGVRRGPLS
jgi:hypothetical protein